MRPFVSPLFPYSTLFRSPPVGIILIDRMVVQLPDYRIEAIAVVCPPSFSRWDAHDLAVFRDFERVPGIQRTPTEPDHLDRKSTRLNSSHVAISYAVFGLI